MEDGATSLESASMERAVETDSLRERDAVDALWQSLHRDIRRRGSGVHLAEDVTQEAWLRTLARRPETRCLEPWLLVVGRRVLLEFLRNDLGRIGREKRVARREAQEAENDSGDSRILRLVAELPDPYREIVTLRYVEDLEVEEIARYLGSSPATVRSQLRRGIDRLRARIDERDQPRTRRSPAILFMRLLGGGDRPGVRWALAGSLACVALVALFLWSSTGSSGDPGASIALRAAPGGELAHAPALAPGESALPRREAIEPPSSADPTAIDPAEPLLSGTVRLPDGTPVAGATIWKSSLKGKRRALVTRSDEEGRFSYKASEVKVAFLWATHPEWLPSRHCHFEIHDYGPRELVLAPSRGRLELRVLEEDRPVAGAEVELDWGFDHPAAAFLASNGSMQAETESTTGVTDPQGRIELRKPARSDVLLRVRVPGRACHVERLGLAGGDSSLDVSLKRAATLIGFVADGSGAPAANARVELRTRGGLDSLALAADPSGAFTVALDPGAFELRAGEDPEQGAEAVLASGVLAPGERRSVQLQVARSEAAEATGAPRSEPALRPLELQFVFDEPALLPDIIELRLDGSDTTRAFGLDEEGLALLSVPVSDDYRLAVWVPGLGPWEIDGAELASVSTRRIHVPRPASVAFLLVAPPGTRLDSVRGGICLEGLAFVSSWRDLTTYRELSIDPASSTAQVRLLPGPHRYFFDVPGLAHASGVVTVTEGEESVARVELESGVESEVLVPTHPDERTPELAVITPAGRHELDGVSVRLTEEGALFHVSLPLDALELEARAGDRTGSVLVPAGELVLGRPRPSLRIELGPR